MSQGRMTLEERIKEKFICAKTKEICITSSKDYLNRGMASRVFNSFPALLPDTEIDKLTKSFLKIITEIDTSLINEITSELANDKDKEKLSEWTINIIKSACEDLLDNNNQIKKTLCNLLTWDTDLSGQKKIIHILCSYVVNIYQEVLSKVQLMEEEIIGAFTLSLKHVTAHYEKWVQDILDEIEWIFVDPHIQATSQPQKPSYFGQMINFFLSYPFSNSSTLDDKMAKTEERPHAELKLPLQI